MVVEGMEGGMEEVTVDVEAIMRDSVIVMAITPITGDMAMVHGVILTGGTILTTLTIMRMVCAGFLDTGELTLILGKGLGYLACGFHAIKIR
jgi:hypothetical protein